MPQSPIKDHVLCNEHIVLVLVLQCPGAGSVLALPGFNYTIILHTLLTTPAQSVKLP